MYTGTKCETVPAEFATAAVAGPLPEIKRVNGELTYKDALKEALVEEMARDRRVVFYGEDVADYGGAFKVTKGLLEAFGRERVFNTPISEACICGTGCGAAMNGLRPVVELMYFDFALMSSDQISNQAAKWHYMSGAQTEVPLVIRCSAGAGKGYGGQHSQTLESMFCHIPGLYVVYPATPYDAKGMLKSAIRDNNPVLFVESQALYGMKGPVPEGDYLVPLGVAEVKREGSDITLVAWGPLVHDCLKAADKLKAERGVTAEVIDLRSLVPLDLETVLRSVRKTGRCVVASQAIHIGSYTGEIASTLQDLAFDYLDAPIKRVGAKNGIAPQSHILEAAFLPNVERHPRRRQRDSLMRMATPIVMPKFGQMTEHGAIVEWRKSEGDPVAKGDILFTVETDKSVMDVESFEAGTLIKILLVPGVSVPVQSIVGFLGQPGEAIPEVAAPAPAPASAAAGPTPGTLRPTRGAARSASGASRVTTDPAAPPVFRISPRAAALARECVIDPARITGTGPEGRIVEKDVTAYLKAEGYDRLRIAPAARALAASEKLDILAIRGTGDSGRISVADVRRALAERPRPMSRMRRIIARRLTESVLTAPHFFVTVEVDMTALIELRARLKADGAPQTLTDFISLAVIRTLQEFPDVNSTTDGEAIRWNSHVHLGLAVSLEQGLVVPVVRDAETLTLAELSARSRELAGKARSNKLGPDDMTGGTFTISNMGMLDVDNFTAIINPGEGAILAVSSTLQKPVARDGQVVVRSSSK